MKFSNLKLAALATAALMLSGCGSQFVRSEGEISPFCLLAGGGIGAGTAAALGATGGPIGLGAVIGIMLGGLACPEQPAPAAAVATTEYVTPIAPPDPAPIVVQALDSDGDGVADGDDKCPDTARGAHVDRRGCADILLTLTGLNFKFDSSDIEPVSAAILDDAVTALNRHLAVDILIEGHTDSIGSDAYNLKLSQRRAKAVLDYLVRHGVTHTRMTTAGKGEAQPIAPNDTAENRYRNRRVEFRVVADDGDPPAAH